MTTLIEQLKRRRVELGLKQHDMMLRVGVSRQQYQRLESKGNPRLNTLELLAKGLNSELMLIPQDKLAAVKAILACDTHAASSQSLQGQSPDNLSVQENTLANDPWKDLLPGDE